MQKEGMKSVLVIGGSGALGKSIVSSLKKLKQGSFVYSADLIKNEEASKNIILPKKYEENSLAEIKKNFDHKFDCIINVAGAFRAENLSNEEIIAVSERMYNANVLTSILAAHIAKTHMNKNGLLIFTGAIGVKDSMGTGILAYQLAKNSVYYLTNLLSENPEELQNVSKIITLLP